MREFLKERGLNLSPFPAEYKGSVLLEVTQAVFNGEIYKASKGKMAIIHPVAPRYSIGEEEKYEKDLKTTLANCIRTYFGAVSQYNIGGEKKPLCALSLMGCVIFGGPRDMESKVGTFLTCFNQAVQEVAEEKSSDEMDEFLKRVIICPGYLQEYDALKSELRRKIGEVKEFHVENFVASEAALLDSREGEMLVDKDRAGPKDRAGAGEVGKAYRRDSDAAEEGASFLVELGGQTSTDNPATEVMPTSFWRNLLGCCFGRGHN